MKYRVVEVGAIRHVGHQVYLLIPVIPAERFCLCFLRRLQVVVLFFQPHPVLLPPVVQ